MTSVEQETGGNGGGKEQTHIEDESYAKSSLGTSVEEEHGFHKILGVQWDVTCDIFQFDVGEVAATMEGSQPTKTNVARVTAKFFDPLGVVAPITILFKIFAQKLCEARVGWDEALSGRLLEDTLCSRSRMPSHSQFRDVYITLYPLLIIQPNWLDFVMLLPRHTPR